MVPNKADAENMPPNTLQAKSSPLGVILSPIKAPRSKAQDAPLSPLDLDNVQTVMGGVIQSVLESPNTAAADSPKQVLASPITTQDLDMRKLQRTTSDLTIANAELVRVRDLLERDLKAKTAQLKTKNVKINELIQENTHLLKELQRERETNEEDFTTWTEKKFELEAKIRSLNDMLLKRIQNDELQSTKDIDHSESMEMIQSLQMENEKLAKRVNILERDNELEVQSKMLIIDELETLRANYNDLGEDYEQIKLDYDELVTEYSLNQAIDVTPTLDNAETFCNPKVRHVSSSSSITVSPAAAEVNGKRSLSRAIRDTEVQSQKAKYSQIIMNYEFTIKSLTLQTEKLISYIGYIEQQMAGGPQGQAEYSDDINIRNAKKSIKTIMRSVSAMGLGATDRELQLLDLNLDGAAMAQDDDSFCESLAYSTDYNRGNVTNLDVGSDFSFNEIGDGDDELEEEEGDDSVVIHPMAKFASTDSLNVSYQMHFQPALRTRKSKMLKEPSTTHVKRITKLPSEMDIRGHNFQGEEYYSMDHRVSAKNSMKALSNAQLIHGDAGATPNGGGGPEAFKIMGDDDNVPFAHISEGDEEFDDISQVSSEPSEDEGAVGISTKELDEFRMVWRSGFCAKHSLLLCLCHQRGLVNNLMLQFAMNPIYRLRKNRRMPLRYRRAAETAETAGRAPVPPPIPLIDMGIVD